MNYCFLVKKSPIHAYFDPSLLQIISGNPLFHLGNLLHSDWTVFEYAFLDRGGLKSLNVPRRLSSTVNGIENITL